MKAGLIITGIVAVALAVFYFVARLDKQQEYNTFDEAITMAENNQKSVHDESWKVIKTAFKVEENMREDYGKAIEAYMARGESYQNAMFIWAQEAQLPPPSEQLRMKMMNQTQDLMSKFTSYRNELTRVVAERNTFVRNPWNYIFLTSEQRKPIEARIITSSVTNNAFETGEDDMDWLD